MAWTLWYRLRVEMRSFGNQRLASSKHVWTTIELSELSILLWYDKSYNLEVQRLPFAKFLPMVGTGFCFVFILSAHLYIVLASKHPPHFQMGCATNFENHCLYLTFTFKSITLPFDTLYLPVCEPQLISVDDSPFHYSDHSWIIGGATLKTEIVVHSL